MSAYSSFSMSGTVFASMSLQGTWSGRAQDPPMSPQIEPFSRVFFLTTPGNLVLAGAHISLDMSFGTRTRTRSTSSSSLPSTSRRTLTKTGLSKRVRQTEWPRRRRELLSGKRVSLGTMRHAPWKNTPCPLTEEPEPGTRCAHHYLYSRCVGATSASLANPRLGLRRTSQGLLIDIIPDRRRTLMAYEVLRKHNGVEPHNCDN